MGALLTDDGVNRSKGDTLGIVLFVAPFWPLAIFLASAAGIYEKVRDVWERRQRVRKDFKYKFLQKLYKLKLIRLETMREAHKRLNV